MHCCTEDLLRPDHDAEVARRQLKQKELESTKVQTLGATCRQRVMHSILHRRTTGHRPCRIYLPTEPVYRRLEAAVGSAEQQR